jgi:hypothetical protein
MALASSRQPRESFKSPWGRGMMLRTTEVGRSRRSGTVLKITRRRKNPVRGVFWGKYSRTHNRLRTGDSIPVFYRPLP